PAEDSDGKALAVIPAIFERSDDGRHVWEIVFRKEPGKFQFGIYTHFKTAEQFEEEFVTKSHGAVVGAGLAYGGFKCREEIGPVVPQIGGGNCAQFAVGSWEWASARDAFQQRSAEFFVASSRV